MKVKDLIKRLKQGDPNDLVRMFGSIEEDGTGQIHTIDSEIEGGNHSVIKITK